jgi:hypothetical protein
MEIFTTTAVGSEILHGNKTLVSKTDV